MTLEEILKHPRISNIDVRHNEEDDNFIVYSFGWDEIFKWCRPGRPETGGTLNEALAKVVTRFDLDCKDGEIETRRQDEIWESLGERDPNSRSGPDKD